MKTLRIAGMLLLGLLLTTDIGMAASATELNAKTDATIDEFYQKVPSGQALAQKAHAMLIFPEVYKAGFVVGGEYGEGVMREAGRTVDYYMTAGLSFGYLLGVQTKSIVLLFMTRQSLDSFRASHGWEAGVDGSIALADAGVGKDFDTTNLRDPIIGFVFNNKGLMANLSLEGSKITRIRK